MNRVFRTIGMSLVSLFMLVAYVSGALLCASGGIYLMARADNPEAVEDFTDTASFRTFTRETFDELYRAVTTGEYPEVDKRVAYFAYSLDTNILYCSDPQISDIPSFEEVYATGDPYVFYCRYTADTFRGVNACGTEDEAFEYAYANATDIIFDGNQRNYKGTAIIVAVMPPESGTFDGFGVTLLESYLLRQGIGLLAMLLGIFCVSLSIVLFAVSLRRRIERAIAKLFGWIYLEIRLALLVLTVLFCTNYLSWPIDYRFWAVLSIAPWPILYLLYCNLRYAGGSAFFTRSAILHIARFARREINELYPVSSLQLTVRLQAARLIIFGLVLPFAMFFLGDLLLGTEIVRLLIPFFPLYFGVLFVLFFRKYAELINEISDLERTSAMLPLGEQVPQFELDEDDLLAPLAKNLYDIDKAVEARAEVQFKNTHKKLAQIAGSAAELKEQLRLLEADIRAAEGGNADPATVYVGLKRVSELAAAISDAAVPDRPVTAPTLKRFDLLPLLAEVEAARCAELSAARLTVRTDAPKEAVLITADPLHIRTVLDIVYTNAAMYASADTAVEVQIRREGDNWRFIMMNPAAKQPANADEPESALASGLAQARTYLALNGGELDYTYRNGKFGVSFVLPVAH
ncbi:MAG: HAMP domain-containing histidine kinase [Clostridia bacterium]|nr:HAMP domain-containing histidine kinase [Clostridia bacterium]